MDITHQVVADTFHQESGRILATLIGSVMDFELAEDALQDAMLVALERWPVEGIPRNPGAWITTAARHKAIDRLRRMYTLARKQELLQSLVEQEEPVEGGGEGAGEMEDSAFPDERLKLMFTCCHPALALEAHGIPYRVPGAGFLGERVDAILCVLYLIFNEGYAATSGNQLIRQELCDEAIRLARVLTMLLREQLLLAAAPEALGLLALLLLHNSRRKARVGAEGELVLLEEQDRALWNQQEIQEGLAALELD